MEPGTEVTSGRARGRGRPARIDATRIVDTAREIGLHSFSMDDLAGRLGVTTPALYTHVDGRSHIVELAATDILGAADDALVEATEWDEWLRAWAAMLHEELGAVGPTLVEVVRDRVRPNDLQAAEHGLALLVAAGFTAADAARILWLVARLACTGSGPTGPGLRDVAATTRSTVGEDASAVLSAALDEADSDSPSGAFEFELDVVVDGLRAHLAST